MANIGGLFGLAEYVVAEEEEAEGPHEQCMEGRYDPRYVFECDLQEGLGAIAQRCEDVGDVGVGRAERLQ